MKRSYKYPNKLILEALIHTQGNISQAALDIGCSRPLIYSRLANNPEMRSALEDARKQPLVNYDFTWVNFERLSTRQLKYIRRVTGICLELRGVEIEY